LRAKDSELSRHLAFAPCSALNFTCQDGNAKFANGEMESNLQNLTQKASISANPLEKNTNQTARTNLQKPKFNAVC
jgi:hypothetical protein